MSVHKKILEKHHLDQDSTPYQQPAVVPDPVIVSETERVNELLQQAEEHNSFNHIRATSQIFPYSKQTYFDAKMPFALVMTPYGVSVKDGFPDVNYGNNPILRCDNCRAYLNPFMTFHSNGEDVRCNLCLIQNRLPAYFVRPLVNGRRDDYHERAELNQGSYDIRAGQEYQARPPMPPTYLFMLDVSIRSHGYLPIICSILKDLILDNHYDVRTLFGLVTFDTQIQLYNLNSSLKAPQMHVIADSSDNEFPIPDELLFNLNDSKDVILALLSSLPNMFSAKPMQTSTQFNRALKFSQRMMASVGGKLIILLASNNFEVIKQDKDINFMTPTSPAMSQICAEMHMQYICPSIFVIPHDYMNAITLNELVKYLNGDMYYYDDPDNSLKHFYYDIKNVLEREYAWEAVFRIRTSTGWRIRQTYGNYSIKNNDLLSVTCIDENKTLTYELELINPSARHDVLYIQTALLYTSSQGERRIRVHNYCLPLARTVTTIYNHVDVPTIAAVLLKFGLYKLYKTPNIGEVQQFIFNAGRALAQNAKLMKSESLDSLPQYLLGLMKLQVFNHPYTKSYTTDKMNCLRGAFNSMLVDHLAPFIIPQLYRLEDFAPDDCTMQDGVFLYPQQVSLSLAEIQSGGSFLMDTGNLLILMIAKNHDPTIPSRLFSKSYAQISLTEDMLYQDSSALICTQLHLLIQQLRFNKPNRYAPIQIVKQMEKSRYSDLFMQLLIYDDLNVAYRKTYDQFIASL